MKTKFVILLLAGLIISGCKESRQPGSAIKGLLESQALDTSTNALIYTINPNDCLNCLIGFSAINDQLSKVPISKIYIISVEREIEKQKLSKNLSGVDLNPATNKLIIWSRTKMHEVNLAANLGPDMSSVIIYNYQKDSVLFAKPAREIHDASIIKNLLPH